MCVGVSKLTPTSVQNLNWILLLRLLRLLGRRRLLAPSLVLLAAGAGVLLRLLRLGLEEAEDGLLHLAFALVLALACK